MLSADAALKRVRRELRSMSNKDLNRYKLALRVMQSVPTLIGQQAFGPKYKDYRYFLLKHAAAAYDPRNDQVRSVHMCGFTLLLPTAVMWAFGSGLLAGQVPAVRQWPVR